MTVKKPKLEAMGLVGRCFVRIGDDGFWNNQGVIRGEPTRGYYLCQFFSCIDGSPTDLTISKLTPS